MLNLFSKSITIYLYIKNGQLALLQVNNGKPIKDKRSIYRLQYVLEDPLADCGPKSDYRYRALSEMFASLQIMFDNAIYRRLIIR